jgi:Methyltransferase domain
MPLKDVIRRLPDSVKYLPALWILRDFLRKQLFANPPGIDYPALREVDLANAKLFATRRGMIEAFRPVLLHKNVAEVGVLLGDFSAVLVDTLHPAQFIAFDTFQEQKRLGSDVFSNLTHREYYEKRMSIFNCDIIIEEGDGATNLNKYDDYYFDMIYVDADHSFEAVTRDAAVAKKKISDGGILIFNDYMIINHHDMHWYGVVAAVNKLVVEQGCEVVGFALDKDMFCDIALRHHKNRPAAR